MLFLCHLWKYSCHRRASLGRPQGRPSRASGNSRGPPEHHAEEPTPPTYGFWIINLINLTHPKIDLPWFRMILFVSWRILRHFVGTCSGWFRWHIPSPAWPLQVAGPKSPRHWNTMWTGMNGYYKPFAKISTGWVVSTGLKTMLLRADYHPSGDIGYTMPHPHDHP